MLISQEQLSHLISKIYDAALEPDNWEQFMKEGRKVFNATGSTFLQLDSTSPDRSVIDINGIDPCYEAETLERRENEDFWYLEAKNMNSGSIMFGSDMISIDAMHSTPFYQEVVCHLNIEYMLGCVVQNITDRQYYLSFLRGQDANNFSTDAVAAINLLMPHIQRAYFFQQQLARQNTFKEALEASSYGVVVLDSSNRSIFVNRLAEQYFMQQDGISLCNRRIKFSDNDDHKSLDSAIRQTMSPLSIFSSKIQTLLTATRPSGKLPYQIQIHPLNTQSDVVSLMENAACLLFIHDPTHTPSLPFEKIQIAYALTAAEARLCEHLFEGGTLVDIADRLGISLNTAKTHLKHIFQKCNVSNQSELIRLLALGLK